MFVVIPHMRGTIAVCACAERMHEFAFASKHRGAHVFIFFIFIAVTKNVNIPCDSSRHVTCTLYGDIWGVDFFKWRFLHPGT